MVTRSSIVLLVKSQLHGQTMHPTETFISPVLFKIPCIGMVIFDLHFCSMTSKNPVAFITRGYCIAAYICAILCFCCCCFKQKENTTSPFLGPRPKKCQRPSDQRNLPERLQILFVCCLLLAQGVFPISQPSVNWNQH